MIAALILVVSTVMMAQFAIFLWRANMLATAAQPISDALASAQLNVGQTANLEDFDTVAALSKLCPGVRMRSVSFWAVCAYYRSIRSLSQLCSAVLPQGAIWARQEMAFCTRYVAVSLDRRLLSNQAYLAALRPY